MKYLRGKNLLADQSETTDELSPPRRVRDATTLLAELEVQRHKYKELQEKMDKRDEEYATVKAANNLMQQQMADMEQVRSEKEGLQYAQAADQREISIRCERNEELEAELVEIKRKLNNAVAKSQRNDADYAANMREAKKRHDTVVARLEVDLAAAKKKAEDAEGAEHALQNNLEEQRTKYASLKKKLHNFRVEMNPAAARASTPTEFDISTPDNSSGAELLFQTPMAPVGDRPTVDLAGVELQVGQLGILDEDDGMEVMEGDGDARETSGAAAAKSGDDGDEGADEDAEEEEEEEEENDEDDLDDDGDDDDDNDDNERPGSGGGDAPPRGDGRGGQGGDGDDRGPGGGKTRRRNFVGITQDNILTSKRNSEFSLICLFQD